MGAPYDSSNTDIPRKTVITSHNSKAYQVDGMTTEITIKTPDIVIIKEKDGT